MRSCELRSFCKPLILPLVLLLGLTLVIVKADAAPALDSTEVVSGLSSPVFVTAPPGDTSRLFVIEQPGRIRIVKNGSLLTEPFLDITGQVSFGGERGLLGMAFHPDYDNNGYFFINYTRSAPVDDGATVVARYTVSGNPDSADEASAVTILTQSQPFGNHNAGMLAFGPNDGYLYVGFGDGGGSGDTQHNGQDSTTWLGKMLRIDVNGALPYTVPTDNPYVGQPGWLPEIWALGLRNPWRYSFDSQTGDFYIADVGQNSWEEIDFQPATSGGGDNYGWRYKEGDHCFNPSSGCEDSAVMVDPIEEYEHPSEWPFRCSITGGFVYRGNDIVGLDGTYFYADYCTGEIWSFVYDGSTISDSTDHTDALNPDSSNISSFGLDARGELYYCSIDQGKVVKITAAAGTCCVNIRGNVNGDNGDSIDISDVTYMVKYQFKGGPEPPCPEEGNVNGDGVGLSGINISDLTYLVAFQFKGGPPPPSCP